MQDYIVLSIETHLFFARIMKEHALFLEAGFPCKDQTWIQKADHLRQQFEELLRDVVRIANGNITPQILRSEELVTPFTIPAENRTSALSGVPIDSRIAAVEQRLRPAGRSRVQPNLIQLVHNINDRALHLLDDLILFKEAILRNVKDGRLFTVNYPLLIEHILREARMYRSIVEDLLHNKCISRQDLIQTENFWNQIMMEHALFIRGLLDPTEEELIDTADDFASTYKALLETSRDRNQIAEADLRSKSLEETLQIREFKKAGTQGILNLTISSIILPLLADHVLREANHYIRLLS